MRVVEIETQDHQRRSGFKEVQDGLARFERISVSSIQQRNIALPAIRLRALGGV
jgi:hypothetical protein